MDNLTREDALRLRRASHLLGGSELTPAEVVDRAIALQGQDLPAVLRAIAMRSAPGTTVADVRAAFDRGELVRSWPVRGTLFATTPAHLRALLSLTSERLHRATVKRRAALELDDATITAARDIGLRMMASPGEGPTRAELLEAWEDAGISAAGGRGYHLIVHNAIGGAWHWGRFRGEEQELVATPSGEVPDDPLPGIVRGLVAARGPVTDADLAWWLKLPKGQVRAALAGAGVTEVAVDGAKAFVVADAVAGVREPDGPDAPIDLVPGFDEWILGYEDRSLVASPEMQAALVPGNNGVFKPAVLLDGTVVGTWQGLSKTRRESSHELFEKVRAADRRRIDAALAAWPLA
ncbi:winged helix DNA-binding domain-containing protein [Microbacterium halophytorum]|uniref:winged helix DNA-binding domain-containing protein n=1 Tax=Microbacterium halophytorum TaxID=2067568 RepID=UPI000CFD264D|nr:winged helix DNA-binding domain-containing protein [Microbacterium halophytorum]